MLRLSWNDIETNELHGIVVVEIDENLYVERENAVNRYLVDEGRVHCCNVERTTRIVDIGEFIDVDIA